VSFPVRVQLKVDLDLVGLRLPRVSMKSRFFSWLVRPGARKAPHAETSVLFRFFPSESGGPVECLFAAVADICSW
jgi:hypothetical protein